MTHPVYRLSSGALPLAARVRSGGGGGGGDGGGGGLTSPQSGGLRDDPLAGIEQRRRDMDERANAANAAEGGGGGGGGADDGGPNPPLPLHLHPHHRRSASSDAASSGLHYGQSRADSSTSSPYTAATARSVLWLDARGRAALLPSSFASPPLPPAPSAHPTYPNYPVLPTERLNAVDDSHPHRSDLSAPLLSSALPPSALDAVHSSSSLQSVPLPPLSGGGGGGGGSGEAALEPSTSGVSRRSSTSRSAAERKEGDGGGGAARPPRRRRRPQAGGAVGSGSSSSTSSSSASSPPPLSSAVPPLGPSSSGEWRIQLKEKERALQADEERTQRRAAAEEKEEADVEDEEEQRTQRGAAAGEGGGGGAGGGGERGGGRGGRSGGEAGEGSDYDDSSPSPSSSGDSGDEDEDEDDDDEEDEGEGEDDEEWEGSGAGAGGRDGGGGGAAPSLSDVGPPLDRRRSSANDGELRITIIGELPVSEQQLLQRRPSQAPASAQHWPFSSPAPHSSPIKIAGEASSATSTASGSPQTISTPPLSTSAPPPAGRSVVPFTERTTAGQALLSSSDVSSSLAASSSAVASTTSSPPVVHPAPSATISPPFPAPPVLSTHPTPLHTHSGAAALAYSSAPAAAAAGVAPSSSFSSPRPPASTLGASASGGGGGGGGSCRVLRGVDSLLRSRYDSNYDRPDQPVWITVENASSHLIEVIGKHFDLHPLTIEDCQSAHTREKLEIFQHYLFLVFHALQHSNTGRRRKQGRTQRQGGHKGHRTKHLTAGRGRRGSGQRERAEHEDDATSTQLAVRRRRPPRGAAAATDDDDDDDDDDSELEEDPNSGSSMRTTSIKLIVFPHLVLSFTSGLRLPTLLAVRHRLRRVYDNRLESTAWIIHALLDAIVDALLPVVDGTVLEVDALEDLIYVLSGSEHRDLLKRMGLTRRRLSFLRQRLWSKRDILMSLIGKDWQLFLAGVQIPYLRDVYDHVVTMLHSTRASHHTSLTSALATAANPITRSCAPLRVLPRV